MKLNVYLKSISIPEKCLQDALSLLSKLLLSEYLFPCATGILLCNCLSVDIMIHESCIDNTALVIALLFCTSRTMSTVTAMSCFEMKGLAVKAPSFIIISLSFDSKLMCVFSVICLLFQEPLSDFEW